MLKYIYFSIGAVLWKIEIYKMILNTKKIKEKFLSIKETIIYYKKFFTMFLKLAFAFFTTLYLVPFFEVYTQRSFDPLNDLSPEYGGIACVLLTISVLILPKGKLRYLFFGVFCLIVSVWNFLQIGHLILFGENITYTSVLTMLNTDPRIAGEFVGYSFNGKVLGGLILSLLPFLWLTVVNPPYQIKIQLEQQKLSSLKTYILIPFLFILAVCGLIVHYQPYRFPFYNQSVAAAYRDVKDFAERSKRMQVFDLSEVQTMHSDKEQLHVIVIGESAYRPEMSLYGNPIKTTPFADSIKDNLYIFDDVTSPSAQTAPVISRILTFSESYFDRSKMWSEPGLIDFYNAAGFETYWISAHSMYGLFDNYSHLLQRVKHQTFINKFQQWNRGFDAYKIDENLLPELDRALADPAQKKVIFIHLMGSHRLYEDRYPDNYQENNPEFDLGDDVDERYVFYIKSLYYTDWVFSEIFKRVYEHQDASSFILYFSDHAESVSKKGDEYRHADAVKDPRSLEIPFFVWFSDNYKEENADFIRSFDEYLHRPYETTWLLHSLMDLSRISHPKIQPEKSLFSPNFKGFKHRKFEEWKQLSSF